MAAADPSAAAASPAPPAAPQVIVIVPGVPVLLQFKVNGITCQVGVTLSSLGIKLSADSNTTVDSATPV